MPVTIQAWCAKEAARLLTSTCRSPGNLLSFPPMLNNLVQLLATVRCGSPGRTKIASRPKTEEDDPVSVIPTASNAMLSAPTGQEVNSQRMLPDPNTFSWTLSTTCEDRVPQMFG